MEIRGGELLAIIFGIALVVCLIVLYKRKIIDGELLSGAAEMIHQIEIPEDGSIFSQFVKYAATAVLTVEQMVKNGQINRDNESRKSAAMEIVKTAAEVDNIPYMEAEEKLASACIEAEVHKMHQY